MAIAALFPVFCLIALGYLLKRWAFPGDRFWDGAERITYYIFFPCLLFLTLAKNPSNPFDAAKLAGVVFAGTTAAALAALLIRPLLATDGPGFTSVFQGSIRPNTYVGLAAAAGLGGADAVAAAATALAVIVPTVNVMCVTVLTRHGSRAARGEAGGPALVVRELARNPLIIACLAGVAANGVGLSLGLPLERALEALGRAALPIGLLAVGAGLRFRAGLGAWRAIGGASAVKLLLCPALVCLAVRAAGLGGPEATAALLFAAVPTSASSYVLATQMGGDAPLMASIITTETVLAAATLPVVALFL